MVETTRGGPPVYERSGTAAEFRPDARARSSRTSSQKAEFAEQLVRHHAQLLGYIYSLVRDLDDADDLFQQTSLVLWDKFEQFDPSRSFVSWACGVARYEVLNFLRARSRDRLYFGDELSLALIEAQEDLEQERLEERRSRAGGMHEEAARSRQGPAGGLLRPDDRRPRGGRVPGPVGTERPQLAEANPPRLFECVHRSLAQGGVA